MGGNIIPCTLINLFCSVFKTKFGKGTNSLKKKKNVFDVCVCFVLCKFVLGLILWFMDNLWFDDLRAE